MRIGIGTKSFIAFVSTTIVVLVSAAAFVHHNFQRGFVDYVNDLRRGRVEVLTERLAEHYATEGGWEFLRDRPERLRALLSRSGRALRAPHPPRGHRRPPQSDPVGFARGIAVFDEAGARILGPERVRGERFDVVDDGAVVGHVISAPLRALSSDVDISFARRQGQLLLFTLLGGAALAALVAWFFARQLVRPIQTLADGTRLLTAGRYDTRVDVRQRDELGQLASDFNILSGTLERSARQRKELMADVSHELRTPLAALRGQIAALRDGIRPASDDTLGELDAQVGRLVNLVDELYDLSLADAGALSYEKAALDLAEVVRASLGHSASRFEDYGVVVHDALPDSVLPVFGDRRRLLQLFDNLFENSARYTDRAGKVHVTGALLDDVIRIVVEDSAPGVPDEALPRMFERLYRVEKSRSREHGGAGLGLALVEKIAQAHDARLAAAHSQLGGVAITLEFPRHDEAPGP